MPIVSPLEDFSPSGEYTPIQTGKVDLVITRYSLGSVVNHKWVKGASSSVTLTGVNIQPMKDREKLILPEAERTKEWLKIYSNELIRSIKEGVGGHGADEFEYDGNMFQVAKARRYSMGVLNHYKALAVSIERTPN